MDSEIAAMQNIAKALEDLDADARSRVLSWAADRFDASISTPSAGASGTGSGAESTRELTSEEHQGPGLGFATLAELLAVADPKTEADKVLVSAYWLQEVEGEKVQSQPVNKALKDLGHPVSDMPREFDKLIARRPQVVLQLKKAGSTRQARKTFKVTKAGIDQIKAWARPTAQD